MGRLCYISRRYYDRRSAGNKAKCDYEDIVASVGGINLGLRRSFGESRSAAFFLNLAGVIRACALLRRGDTLFLQYPVKKYFGLLCRAAHLRGARVVAFIHDLGCCRRHKLTVAEELRLLSQADYIIAANDAMADWLHSQGLAKPVCALGLHDYLSEAGHNPSGGTNAGDWILTYAGALNRRKNAFITHLDEIVVPHSRSMTLHLYGSLGDYRPSRSSQVRIVEHGYLASDDFITSAEGDFGLVWDGDSLDACTGDFGDYLRLNTPHKCSFYLRAGLPLVVWREAAVAPIVEREGIGLVIDSLRDLPEALSQVDAARMAAMRANVKRLAARLAAGANMKTVLTNLSLPTQ